MIQWIQANFKCLLASFPWKDLATLLISSHTHIFLFHVMEANACGLFFYFQVKQYLKCTKLAVVKYLLKPASHHGQPQKQHSIYFFGIYYKIPCIFVNIWSTICIVNYVIWQLNLSVPASASTTSCQCYFFRLARNAAPSPWLLTLAER